MNIKNITKQFKPFDYIIVLFLMILSFAPVIVFAAQQGYTDTETTKLHAVVKINGEEVDRFTLTGNEETKEITYYPAQGQYNIVEISDEKIRVKEDNSPDQIAVKTGWISEPWQTSICLPHRLVIEIISDEPVETDIDIIAQ